MSSAGLLRPELYYDGMSSDEGRYLRERTRLNWTMKSLTKGRLMGEAMLKREGIVLPPGVLFD